MIHKKIYHFLEKLTDKLVWFAIVALFFIIIIELFFHDFSYTYHSIISTLDYIVISIFIADLIFKYLRIRNIKKFLRSSWLDIIAIFPFFLVLRFLEPFIFLTGLSGEIKEVQLIFHESLEISKETSKIVKEAEAAGKLSRARYLTGFFRALIRSPRFLKAAAFYEQPTGKHHLEKVPGKSKYQSLKNYFIKKKK
jgi:hypothetical protein